MRPLIALMGSAAILLGVYFYLQFAESLRVQPIEQTVETPAAGIYSAKITLTFDAAADEFSLEATSLVLRQQDHELLNRTDAVAAGEPIVIDNLPGIIEGKNEFYFECVPRDDGKSIARAVRVQLLRDGQVVADSTLWADPGQVPRGQITLDVPATRRANDDHAH